MSANVSIPVSAMPLYLSHKKVRALKIKKVYDTAPNLTVLTFEGISEDDADTVSFTPEHLQGKPAPQSGWYMVVYENGYISFSPADAFEDGYTRIGGSVGMHRR